VTRIAGLDLSSTGLQEIAKVLQQEFPKVEFLELVMNLGDEEQVEATFKKVVEKFGRIDYVVNNAAIGSPLLPSTELSSATFDKIISINLKGTWLCERAALRQMITQVPLEKAPGSP
jgi:NAD(P)-dependent dehydrogenase (short-subunit alcohol dehydrogenase family)